MPHANQHSPDLAGLFRNSIDLLGAVLCSPCLNMPTSSPIIKDDLYICLESHKICWIQLNLFCDIFLKAIGGFPLIVPNKFKATVTVRLSPRFFCTDATLLCEFESDKI